MLVHTILDERLVRKTALSLQELSYGQNFEETKLSDSRCL